MMRKWTVGYLRDRAERSYDEKRAGQLKIENGIGSRQGQSPPTCLKGPGF